MLKGKDNVMANAKVNNCGSPSCGHVLVQIFYSTYLQYKSLTKQKAKV